MMMTTIKINLRTALRKICLACLVRKLKTKKFHRFPRILFKIQTAQLIITIALCRTRFLKALPTILYSLTTYFSLSFLITKHSKVNKVI